jgi:inosine/guanosine/xanthosine phosphorylase family protein
MQIEDHLHLMGDHPLRGPNNDAEGPRFPDMTVAWDPAMRAAIAKAASAAGVLLTEGVYAAVSGPSFETPAEVRALRALGADAVGMSTTPECIVARHAGLRVAGISCITNHAAGLGHQQLTHEDVAAAAEAAGDAVRSLIAAAVPAIHQLINPASSHAI